MSGFTRVAIVTGAGQGIGRAIALRLADDGFDVAVNDIPSKFGQVQEVIAEIEKKGSKSLAVFADVSREAEVQAMVDKAVETLGGLDVMVANAGVGGSASIVDMDMEFWDSVMNINLRGVMLCYKYAARHMIKQGRGGRIVAASSVLGKKGAIYSGLYCATKFGVRGLTQSAALELASHKITVNAYAPGVINTAMVANCERIVDIQEDSATATLKKVLGNPDIGDAEPEVIAGLVSYLVKPEAYFITGQTISIDGGLYFS